MCARCKITSLLIRKTEKYTGSYVTFAFPHGIPVLVLADGRRFVYRVPVK